jgi:hypothetical protein
VAFILCIEPARGASAAEGGVSLLLEHETRIIEIRIVPKDLTLNVDFFMAVE